MEDIVDRGGAYLDLIKMYLKPKKKGLVQHTLYGTNFNELLHNVRGTILKLV